VVPPFVGVAVNVAEAPAHSGFVPVVSAIETAGVTAAFTVMVIPFDVAVAGLAQDAFDVITQVTTCPLVNVVEVNVALLVPAFTPSTFH
jgi:hypothetical protein